MAVYSCIIHSYVMPKKLSLVTASTAKCTITDNHRSLPFKAEKGRDAFNVLLEASITYL